MKQQSMINLFIFILIFTIGGIAVTGCKKEYVEAGRTVCFDSEVLPILQTNCTQSGCHNATDKKGGYVLTDYSNVIKRGVIAGDYANSKIYEVLIKNAGDEAMPQAPYAKLSITQISSIALWIKQGAKEVTGCTSTCDTSVAKYSTQIQPLMTNYCTGGCHSGTAPSSGIDLSTFAGVNDAAMSGSLLGSIKGNGFSQMPKNAAKLSDCNISLVEKWVREGALNN
jgi:hypothetical protein